MAKLSSLMTAAAMFIYTGGSVQIFDIQVSKSPFVQQMYLTREFIVPQDTAVTICLFLQLHYLYTNVGTLIEIVDGEINISEKRIQLEIGPGTFKVEEGFEFLKWSHFCAVLGESSAFFVDGEPLPGIREGNLSNMKAGNHVVTVGADFKTTNPLQKSPVGAYFTIPSIFLRALTQEEVKTLVNCSESLDGDIGPGKWNFTWAKDVLKEKETTFVIDGYPVTASPSNQGSVDYVFLATDNAEGESLSFIKSRTLEDVCDVADRGRYILTSGTYTYSEAQSTCEAYGGQLPGRGKDTRKAASRIMREIKLRIVIASWVESNSDDTGDCSILMSVGAEFIFVSYPCDSKGQYLLCKLSFNPAVELRSDKGTKNFFVVADEYLNLRLFSADGDVIESHPNNTTLIRHINKHGEEVGVTQGDSMNPLGRHLWSNGETTILTSCGEGSFTCTKFECIDLNLHCNAEYDCTDNTDEVCDIVKPLNQSYNRNQPSEQNMPVELTVFTKRVHDIDVSKGLVCVWLQLETIWQDSRLEFVQLRDDMTDNKISNSSHIWEPRFTLSNGLFEDDMKYRKRKNVRFDIYAIKEGNVTTGVVRGFESYIYSSENGTRLFRTEDFMISYICNFSLSFFPFDVHLCTIEITLLNQGSLKAYFKNRNQHSLESTVGVFSVSAMQITNNTNGDSFHLKFLVSRNFGAYVLTTFLPVMILGLTGDLSHLFESTNFSDRVMLTLTAFIVAASLFAAVSGTNSGTTEVRALDVFFFYYIFRLFMIVVSHTLQGLMLRKVHRQPTGDKKMLREHALAEVDPKGYLKSVVFSEKFDDAPSTPVYIPLKAVGKEKLLGQAWAIQPTAEKKSVEATPSRFWENTFDKILLTLGIVLDLVFLGLFVAVVIFGTAAVREKFDKM